MIIGISGAQGQGKSTLIKAAAENNHRFESSDIQTARTLLKKWGFSLTEVNTYIPLKVKFQDALLNEHVHVLRNLSDRSGIKLVERTFADIFTYAILSVGPFNQYANWLSDYYGKCKEAQNDLFGHVVYLSGRTYVPEDDGVRSVNPEFASLSDDCIKKYSLEFAPNERKVSLVSNDDLTARVNILNDIVRQEAGKLWHQG